MRRRVRSDSLLLVSSGVTPIARACQVRRDEWARTAAYPLGARLRSDVRRRRRLLKRRMHLLRRQHAQQAVGT